jgi:hypothetical protein
MINLILLYIYTKDRRVLYLYSIIPGVNASIFVVSKVPFIITMILLFLILFKSKKYIFLLPIIFIFDKSSIILSIALLCYGIYYRDKLAIISSLIMILSIFLYYDFSNLGKPRGYFVDIFGIFIAIFSPILFFYFVYTIFEVSTKDRDILWFLTSTGFFVAILLSFRQKVNVEFFAPFLLLSIPIIIKIFFDKYYSIIKPLRKKYNILMITAITISILSSIILYTPIFSDFDRENDKNAKKTFFYQQTVQ